MNRYYSTMKSFTNWGPESYTNAIFNIFVLIGKYIGYERSSYVKTATTFTEYIKLLDIYKDAEQRTDLPIIFADRGFKKIRDVINDDVTDKKKYFKGELLYLSKKRTAFPIRLPKRSVEVLNAICEYIKQDKELYSSCKYILDSQYYSKLSSKNEQSHTQALLGFQYEYFIMQTDRPNVKRLYDRIRKSCSEKKILI